MSTKHIKRAGFVRNVAAKWNLPFHVSAGNVEVGNEISFCHRASTELSVRVYQNLCTRGSIRNDPERASSAPILRKSRGKATSNRFHSDPKPELDKGANQSGSDP